jgi:hypothetical protein
LRVDKRLVLHMTSVYNYSYFLVSYQIIIWLTA